MDRRLQSVSPYVMHVDMYCILDTGEFSWRCVQYFVDLIFQDSLDLFLGRYMVEEGEGVTVPCPLDVEKGWKYITVSNKM